MIVVQSKPGVRVVPVGAGVRFESPRRSLTVRELEPTILDHLVELVMGVNLGPLVGAEESGPLLFRREWVSLANWGLVQFHWQVAGERMATGRLAGGADKWTGWVLVEPGQRVGVGRFCMVRREGRAWIVESALSPMAVEGSPLAVQALAIWADSGWAAGTDNFPGALTKEACLEGASFFASMGILGPLDDHGRMPEEATPGYHQREVHDVFLHRRSRRGLTLQPVGGTYPFRETPPPPLLEPRPWEPSVSLPVPSEETMRGNDRGLFATMERRRSTRRFCATNSVTVGELSEFLFRVARERRTSVGGSAPAEPDANLTNAQPVYEVGNRTYPSGGGMYDVELYLALAACQGLDKGFYHYDPRRHSLCLVNGNTGVVDRLVDDACAASGCLGRPDLVVVLSSRFQRMSWKYEGLCYATTLKNVGVLFEAMYLVSTAMDLAACALGAGDSALFARATGLHPLVESSVGEFAIGASTVRAEALS